MKTSSRILKNEKGSAIIAAMMILVLLTIIGIAATNTSTFESQIIGNEHRYQIDFYVADSGWKEGAMWLENSGAPPPNANPGGSNIVRNWGNGLGSDPPPTIQDVINTPDNNSLSKYAVPYWYQVEYVQDRIVPGSGSTWREFSDNARSNANQTQEIEVTLAKIYRVGY
jgi:Tfp pilus assembly protein PilX